MMILVQYRDMPNTDVDSFDSATEDQHSVTLAGEFTAFGHVGP